MTTTFADATTYTTPSVISPDGATISYLTLGRGPAVIVIPGALSVAADYAAFGRALAERFTVHIMERRGRGESSPQGADYSIRKECEDVLALQRQTGARALVGHSFGGFVALETRAFPGLDHFGIDQKAPQTVARAVSAYFLTEHASH